MKKLTAVTLCALPLLLMPVAYGQGTGGPSGSGAMSAEKQSEPVKRDADSKKSVPHHDHKSMKKSAPPSADKSVQQGSSSNPQGANGTASNRSSSGNSTGTTANQAPGNTGKSSKAN